MWLPLLLYVVHKVRVLLGLFSNENHYSPQILNSYRKAEGHLSTKYDHSKDSRGVAKGYIREI